MVLIICSIVICILIIIDISTKMEIGMHIKMERDGLHMGILKRMAYFKIPGGADELIK